MPWSYFFAEWTCLIVLDSCSVLKEFEIVASWHLLIRWCHQCLLFLMHLQIADNDCFHQRVVFLISLVFPFTLTYRLGFVYMFWFDVVCQWCRICCEHCDGSLSTSITASAMDSPYTRIPCKIDDGFLPHTFTNTSMTTSAMDSSYTRIPM